MSAPTIPQPQHIQGQAPVSSAEDSVDRGSQDASDTVSNALLTTGHINTNEDIFESAEADKIQADFTDLVFDSPFGDMEAPSATMEDDFYILLAQGIDSLSESFGLTAIEGKTVFETYSDRFSAALDKTLPQAPRVMKAALISELLLLPIILMQVSSQTSRAVGSFATRFKEMAKKAISNPLKTMSVNGGSLLLRGFQRTAHITGILFALDLMNTTKQKASYAEIFAAALATQVLTNGFITILDSMKINGLKGISKTDIPEGQVQASKPTLHSLQNSLRLLAENLKVLPQSTQEKLTGAKTFIQLLQTGLKSGNLKPSDIKHAFSGFWAMNARNTFMFTGVYIGQQFESQLARVSMTFGSAFATSIFDAMKNRFSVHGGLQIQGILGAARTGAPRPCPTQLQFINEFSKVLGDARTNSGITASNGLRVLSTIRHFTPKPRPDISILRRPLYTIGEFRTAFNAIEFSKVPGARVGAPLRCLITGIGFTVTLGLMHYEQRQTKLNTIPVTTVEDKKPADFLQKKSVQPRESGYYDRRYSGSLDMVASPSELNRSNTPKLFRQFLAYYKSTTS